MNLAIVAGLVPVQPVEGPQMHLVLRKAGQGVQGGAGQDCVSTHAGTKESSLRLPGFQCDCIPRSFLLVPVRQGLLADCLQFAAAGSFSAASTCQVTDSGHVVDGEYFVREFSSTHLGEHHDGLDARP
jgi:hypothetical protein